MIRPDSPHDRIGPEDGSPESASRGDDSDEVADHYDELDRLYREIWGEHVHHGFWDAPARGRGGASREEAVVRLIEEVVSGVDWGAHGRVADVGAGYGATARYLAERHGADVTGITLSAAQHGWATEHAESPDVSPGRVEMVRGDWLENEFPDESFDLVLAIESTEHMRSLATCLREARRTLRSQGRFLACVWCARERPSAWERRRLLEPICREGRLTALHTPEEYAAVLREAGFREIDSTDWTSHVRRTWRVVLRRMAVGVIRRPEYRSYLFDAGNRHRVFAWTAVRILVAQHLGALRYVRFSAVAP